MGLFKFLAEKKVIKNTQKLLALQNNTFQRFTECKNSKKWAGAAADTRMMLEAFAYIEHVFALHSQNNGFYTPDYNSKFAKHKQAAYKFQNDIVGVLADTMIKETEYRNKFIELMKNETSKWKSRMAWILYRDTEELKFIENEIK